MIRIIWMITFTAALFSLVTMNATNRGTNILAWVLLVITMLGVIALLTLVYGGTIYL